MATASICAVSFASVTHAEAADQNVAAAATQQSATTGTRSDAGVGEIIVTAQKRSESINTVPMSITAVSGEQLLAKGVNGPADLVKVLPSLQVTQTQKGNPVYTLRGVGFFDGTQGSRPTVGLYVDEVELPFSSMARGATLDLERVEVLKGPQGTLFGQNATGGVINYIAAKPTDVLHYGGSATYGRFSEGNIQGYVSGPLNDTLSVRLAGKHEFGSGWQKSYTRDETLGDIDVTTARLQLDWHPSERVKFLLNLNGFNDRSESQAPASLEIRSRVPGALPAQFDGYPPTPRNPRAADWDVGGNFRNDTKFRQASLRGDFELGDIGTLTSLSSYAHMDILTRADADGVNFPNLVQNDTSTLETAAQELRLAGDIGSRLSYVVGTSYAWYRAEQYSDQRFTISSINGTFAMFGITDPLESSPVFVSSRYKTLSAFGNIDYKITDALKIHAGIRYSETKAKSSGCMLTGEGDEVGFSMLYSFVRSQLGLGPVSIAPGGCQSASATYEPGLGRFKLKEHSVPFRVGIDWDVAPRTMVYANVSRGFKGASYPVLGSTRLDAFEAAKQEELTAYEVGFKSSLLNRSLQLNGAAFYYDYKDKQLLGSVFDPIFGPGPKLINVPKSRVYGAELQIDWVPVEGLTIAGGATYLKTKILGCSPADAAPGTAGCQSDGFYNYDGYGSLINLTGQRFAFAPELSGNLDVQYKIAIRDDLNAFIGGSVQAQSSVLQRLGENFALGAADPNRITKQNAYALVDVRLGVSGRDDRWSAFIWGRNVTNKYYKTSTFYSSDTTVGFIGRPATYGLTVTFNH
ncbi:TonB-dependent receptor [Sphingobium sp. JS3065]|uniref:TonB-dependent receptor n=1 Tax=Sphingobium sp. JS3065 TaxID=2970925 RepID=UPI0022645194|nr:TonB-dependent receptor [Sphingobium sp. JS3065]UZW56377.1 TonB-dependent receptor [Sphingobium sp. JS3065]